MTEHVKEVDSKRFKLFGKTLRKIHPDAMCARSERVNKQRQCQTTTVECVAQRPCEFVCSSRLLPSCLFPVLSKCLPFHATAAWFWTLERTIRLSLNRTSRMEMGDRSFWNEAHLWLKEAVAQFPAALEAPPLVLHHDGSRARLPQTIWSLIFGQYLSRRDAALASRVSPWFRCLAFLYQDWNDNVEELFSDTLEGAKYFSAATLQRARSSDEPDMVLYPLLQDVEHLCERLSLVVSEAEYLRKRLYFFALAVGSQPEIPLVDMQWGDRLSQRAFPEAHFEITVARPLDARIGSQDTRYLLEKENRPLSPKYYCQRHKLHRTFTARGGRKNKHRPALLRAAFDDMHAA